MNTSPNLTSTSSPTGVATQDGQVDFPIPWKLDNYITYLAVGGLRLDEDGDMKQLKLRDFADQLGVTRQTLWNWRKNVPNLAQMVRDRRKEMFSVDAESLVWKGVMLRAAKGDAEQAKMFLSHFSDYQLPTQKTEQSVEVKGLGDLIKAALIAKRGEVIDATPDTSLPG